MMKFRVKTKDSCLSVKVKFSDEEINNREFEFFHTNYLKGILKPSKLKNNLLEFSGHNTVSLRECLKKGISKHEFFLIVEQVIELTRKIEYNRFFMNKVVLDFNYIFTDTKTFELDFIYLPFISVYYQTNLLGFLEDLCGNAKVIREQSREYLDKFSEYLRTLKSFDADEIEQYVLLEDRNAVYAIKKNGVNQSSQITKSDSDSENDRGSYNYYCDGYEATDLLDDAAYDDFGDYEQTALLNEDEGYEPTGLLNEDEGYEPTGLLNEDEGYEPTGLLNEDEGYEPTGLLNEYEGYEQTGLLNEDEGYEPTGLLNEDEGYEPTGLLNEDEGYEPTGLLNEDEGYEPTGLLNEDEGYEQTGLLSENEDVFYEDILDNADRYPIITRLISGETVSIDKPVFRIGKEKSYVDYFISSNNTISRSHADIITRGKRCFIVDLNSKNSTYINGQMISAHREYEIFDGDRIRLSNEDFIFNK